MKASFAAILAVASTLNAFATRFSNQFSEFELPPQWQCQLEGAEWVCQTADESKKREAIVILAAKLRGDQDSLDQYLTYLKTPKKWSNSQGKPLQSEVKYAKTIQINDHPWVDALHMESEVPDFYTRYLATIKDDIGVLITYSIQKDKYQLYLNDFDNLVKTLRVFRRIGGLNAGGAGQSLFQSAQTSAGVGGGDSAFSGATIDGNETEQKPAKKKQDDSTLYLILAAAGAVGFIIWRKKKNG